MLVDTHNFSHSQLFRTITKEQATMMASTSNKQENRSDVTKDIYDAVTKMMARAAVNKNHGRHFDIDMDRCCNFINQQIELVLQHRIDSMCNQSQGASESAVMYQDMTVFL